MSKLAVVGAGHAGVEAATRLAERGHSVTLWSNEPCLPYFRPRLIAVAFGQAEAEAIAIKPAAFYEKNAITLRYEAATVLDVASCTLNGEPYEGIVLAQGARPFVPSFEGEGSARIQTLWTMADALSLRAVATPGTRLTIIGGGVLGLEAALRAVQAGLTVTVIEIAPKLLGGALGERGEAVLRETLAVKGIRLLCGIKISAIQTHGVSLADGTEVADDLLLCSAGACPRLDLMKPEGAPASKDICTQADLSLAPRIYAAGDMAQPIAARPVCAVRRATAMGQCAAHNLLAELEGTPPQAWTEPTLPLFMKVGDVEFHTLGDVRSPDLEERRIDDAAQAHVWQSICYRAGQPVGLRFVGTRAGFADWEKRLA